MFNRQTCTALAMAALSLSLALPVTLTAYSPTAMAAESEAQAQDAVLFKEIQDLFMDFYPKATTTSSATNLHFDYKCKKELGYYSGRPVLAPQNDGILCEIAVQPGKYEGKDKDRLPAETQDGFHTDFIMAPYSKLKDQHLLVHMSFPPDMPTDFEERLKALVHKFNANDPVESATPPKPSAATTTIATATPAVEGTAPAATTEATPAATPSETPAAKPTPPPTANFGGSKLSKYSFPEGRFKVELPGAPATKATMMLNMREVDYEYPQGQGTFNISYLILPGNASQAAANPLFDKLQAALVGAYAAVNVQQTPCYSRNFPGRQIQIGGLKKKPGFAGLIRMYLVENYVYIVGVIGRKEWVESPICNQFMTSFEFTTAAEQRTASDQLHKHVAEYEQARKRQEDEAKRNQFSSDVRKALKGNSQSHGHGNYK